MSSSERIPLPTREEAATIVEPIAEQIRQAFRKASDDWFTLYGNVRHIISPRTRAGIFHDHISFHAKALLAETPGIKTYTPRGIFTVGIGERADVRFKHLDQKYRSSNVKTRQNNRYGLQLKLDGFADLPRLTAGYTLDKLQTALDKMLVTLQIGRRVQYVIDLTGSVGQQLLPFPKATPYKLSRPRVKAKKASKLLVVNKE